MSDEMKKQELEESIEGIEPSIEVDTVNEEVVIEPATEEVAEEAMKKEKLAEGEPEAPVEGEEVESEEEGAEEQPVVEEADKSDEESADEEAQEEKSGEESDVPDETPVDSPDEAAVDENEQMRAELEALRNEKEEAEQVNKFFDVMDQTEVQAQQLTANVAKGIEEVAKKYGIPTDISMEELEKQDPTKAQMAKEIMARANAVVEQAKAQLNQVRENAAREVVFRRAGKLLDGYEMTEEQKGIAATTFIRILNEVGVKDLAEDLKAKVKLAVAQARMDSPMVAAVADVAQEVLDDTNPKGVPTDPKVEVKADTSVSNEPSPKIEEEVKPVEEVKDEVPPTPKKDLSEYMEGASTSVQKVATVTVDNVLQQLASLPFRERTAFYKEHQDLINQAMTMKRKDVE